MDKHVSIQKTGIKEKYVVINKGHENLKKENVNFNTGTKSGEIA